MSDKTPESQTERAASSSAGTARPASRVQAAIHDFAVYFAVVDDDSGGERPSWWYLATFLVLLVVVFVVADAVSAGWIGTIAIGVAVGIAWAAVARIAAHVRAGKGSPPGSR